MKYPLNSIGKPVVGLQAKKLLKIIESGGSITNEESIKTVERIIKKRNEFIQK